MKKRFIRFAAAALCALFTAQPAAGASRNGEYVSHFECEDAEVYDQNGKRISVPRLTDKNASAGAVAGSTGGKYFRFRNAAEGNLIHISYATHFTDTMELFIRYPGEDEFRYAGQIPFSTSNSWEMSSSYTATSPVVYIPAGSDIQIKPNIDVNLDCLRITSEPSTEAPAANTLSAAMLSEKAVDDIMAPYASAVRMKTGDKITFSAPGEGSLNVLTLSYCSSGAVIRVTTGDKSSSLTLPYSGLRTYASSGVRVGEYSAKDSVTVECVSGELELGAVSVNYAPEPEIVRTDGRREDGGRLTVPLDGIWAFGLSDAPQHDVPETVPSGISFINSIPVPGLYRSASFAEGPYSGKEAWYKKTVVIDKIPSGRAFLYIGSAEYGRYVYVNGKYAGGYEYNYSHSYTDITEYLRPGENEIAVMLGSWTHQFSDKNTPAHVLFDGESTDDEPGFTGSVKLIFTGEKYVEAAQTAPDLENGSVDVRVRLSGKGETDVTVNVYELGVYKNGKPSSDKVRVASVTRRVSAGGTSDIEDVRLDGFTADKCWTPDNPFLYLLEVKTGDDTFTSRFGMRVFDFDPVTHYARLNGKTFYLFGTNVAIERYFDDPLCGTTPWQEDWVRKLYSEFRDVGWVCFRTHLGHAPELWFDIADETGMMIFDEYPIWGDNDGCTVKTIMPEIYAWIDARANHPSLIVFDAQNEGLHAAFTDEMIRLGRDYDIQHRPWDNGWRPPVGENDPVECHPYIIGGEGIRGLGSMNVKRPIVTTADIGWGYKDHPDHPYIINEHGEYWINREGAAMSGTAGTWKNAYPKADNEQRLVIYADLMAAQIEKFRSGRAYSGILFFCGLGSSFPSAQGVTSDVLSPDVSTAETLEIRPYTKERLRCAFADIGIMIDKFTENVKRGDSVSLKVVLVNDTGSPVNGLPVTLKLKRGDTVLYKETKTVDLGTPSDKSKGKAAVSFSFEVPAYKEYCPDGAELQLIASYEANGKSADSLRRWTVKEGALDEGPAPEFETETVPVTETETETSADTAPASETTDEKNRETDGKNEGGERRRKENGVLIPVIAAVSAAVTAAAIIAVRLIKKKRK